MPSRDVSFSDLTPAEQALVLILLGIILFYVFILPPLVTWIRQTWLWILAVVIIIATIAGYVFYRRYQARKIEEAREMAYIREQRAKGLERFFDRHGNEKWGKPKEVEKWKKEDELAREKESLTSRIVDEIEKFKPARERFGHEFSYQLNLHGFLSKTFPQAVIERQKGSSRPDIVIDDVAIEIKGPTGKSELQTIADKLLRYPQHYKDIIVVLFEMQHINQRYYDEWRDGLKKTYPNVRIIEK
jgi:Ca2+/Na+ antiporter